MVGRLVVKFIQLAVVTTILALLTKRKNGRYCRTKATGEFTRPQTSIPQIGWVGVRQPNEPHAHLLHVWTYTHWHEGLRGFVVSICPGTPRVIM
ncbi:hypothetical protein EDC04DRAFT_1757047 [Pisolithus marmoratus]|nr:hypothetical protein EDC04DRAFT_1757047 [Pisolithus marmoratus]